MQNNNNIFKELSNANPLILKEEEEENIFAIKQNKNNNNNNGDDIMNKNSNTENDEHIVQSFTLKNNSLEEGYNNMQKNQQNYIKNKDSSKKENKMESKNDFPTDNVNRNYILDSLRGIQNSIGGGNKKKINSILKDQQKETIPSKNPNQNKSNFTIEDKEDKGKDNSKNKSEGIDMLELKILLQRIDILLGELPNETITKFSNSYYFKIYKKILNKLGLHQ